MTIRRTMAVFLAGMFVFTLGAASAGEDYKSDRKTEVSNSTVNSVESEGFSLVNKGVSPSEAQARHLGELELAMQEYLMYFDAYRDAQQSTSPSERAKAPQLLRSYRIAYTKALKMMRDDKLIHPMIPQNPLKVYMEKAKDAILGDPKERRRIYKEVRKATKDALKEGKSADEIVSIIKDMIAKANANWQEGAGKTPSGNAGGNEGGGNDNSGGSVGKNSDGSGNPGSINPPGKGNFPTPLPPQPGMNPGGSAGKEGNSSSDISGSLQGEAQKTPDISHQ